MGVLMRFSKNSNLDISGNTYRKCLRFSNFLDLFWFTDWQIFKQKYSKLTEIQGGAKNVKPPYLRKYLSKMLEILYFFWFILIYRLTNFQAKILKIDKVFFFSLKVVSTKTLSIFIENTWKLLFFLMPREIYVVKFSCKNTQNWQSFCFFSRNQNLRISWNIHRNSLIFFLFSSRNIIFYLLLSNIKIHRKLKKIFFSVFL